MDDQTQTAQPQKGMSPMLIAGVVILVLVIAGGIFLGSKKSNSQKQAMQEPTPTVAAAATPTVMPSVATTTTPAATGTATTTTAVKEFTVHGGSFYFKPSQLTVKKGDTVKLTFINDGGFHDFVIDELNVKTDVIGSGKSQTVTFTASKTGSFPYYCSVGNHRAMGMQGTLVVQ